MELAGCAALVTGGASGIGAAIAADLELAGARVVIADRVASPIAVDLSRPGEARRMVGEAVERLAGLGIFFNNAGGGLGGTVFPKKGQGVPPRGETLLGE